MAPETSLAELTLKTDKNEKEGFIPRLAYVKLTFTNGTEPKFLKVDDKRAKSKPMTIQIDSN